MAAKKPTPAPDDSGVRLNDYVCVEPIMHNGKHHMPDDPIELTAVDAEPLLSIGAIHKA